MANSEPNEAAAFADAKDLFLATIARFDALGTGDEDDVELAELVPPNWRSEDRLQVARALLVAASIIVTFRGTTRVARGAGSRDPVYELMLSDAQTILAALRQAPERSLTKAECSDLLDDDERYFTAATVLNLLELAVGRRGRRGGLALQTTPSIPPGPPPGPPPEPVKDAGEGAYYPTAEKFLRTQLVGEESEVRVTGGEIVRRGVWNTPDIVGYSIDPCHALELAVVRVHTIEVKLRLDRQGIAEATSHRRFAHYAWLAVPIARADLESPETQEVVRECVDAGLGLACFRQHDSRVFYPHLPPRFTEPDLVQLDRLLSYAFDAELIRSRIRRARARIIAVP